MPATLSLYNNWAHNVGRGVDLSTPPTVNVVLLSSAYTPNQDTHAVYADLTNELSTANGYTNGGLALTGVTWNRATAVATFDAADAVWNVVTANLVARRFALRVVGTFNSLVSPLIGYGFLDDTPADVVTTPGNSLSLLWSASGIFTVTRT
jgi:hypothetical protein